MVPFIARSMNLNLYHKHESLVAKLSWKETCNEDTAMARATIMLPSTTLLESDNQRDWSSDPENPMNWSTLRKYSLVVLISLTNVTA